MVMNTEGLNPSPTKNDVERAWEVCCNALAMHSHAKISSTCRCWPSNDAMEQPEYKAHTIVHITRWKTKEGNAQEVDCAYAERNQKNIQNQLKNPFWRVKSRQQCCRHESWHRGCAFSWDCYSQLAQPRHPKQNSCTSSLSAELMSTSSRAPLPGGSYLIQLLYGRRPGL